MRVERIWAGRRNIRTEAAGKSGRDNRIYQPFLLFEKTVFF